MTDDSRHNGTTTPPVQDNPMQANVKPALDRFAELVFASEDALIEMKIGWEHPGDTYDILKDLQGQALRDIPQFFPDPDRPPLVEEVAEAATAWLTCWCTPGGSNVVTLDAVRALKEESDHA